MRSICARCVGHSSSPRQEQRHGAGRSRSSARSRSGVSVPMARPAWSVRCVKWSAADADRRGAAAAPVRRRAARGRLAVGRRPCGRAPGVAIAGWHGGWGGTGVASARGWKVHNEASTDRGEGRGRPRSETELQRDGSATASQGTPDVQGGRESPGLPNRALVIPWTPISCVQGASDRYYVKKANRK